ncbi:hypothetical protein C5S53_17330 [Methanophagales archaeon]|nr:hypothetical protein C5S53_17330 [Methanophagales archaeon]
MHSANNLTFLTNKNKINFALNSVGFSIVENLPFLQYRRSVHLLTGRKMVVKWSKWVGEGRWGKIVMTCLIGFVGIIEE